MAIVKLDNFLRPISEASPCGENLEYDAAFGELERAARGKEERQSGDEKIAAEEPKWAEVADAAAELMGRTRDVRVALYLTHAALNVEGLSGFAAGLRLVHGFFQNFWDNVYPELDKDDNNDPTLRVNCLAVLDDRAGILRSLGRVPLVDSRAAGRYGLRDIRLAKGELTALAGEKMPDGALIEAAFSDCDIAQLTATAANASEALAALDAVNALLRERVGSERAPRLDNLGKELKTIQSLLNQHLQRRGVGVAVAAGATQAGAAQVQPAVGGIRSREDAIRILEDVSEYFRKNEPSSPVPLLLQRAKRLVSKDFMEILKDLTPKAVSEAEAIGGLNRKD